MQAENETKSTTDTTTPKDSETRFYFIGLLCDYPEKQIIIAKPQTGRTHQIRLHLTSINAPIVGDAIYGKSQISKYGLDKNNFNKFLILKNFQRQALHA